MIRQLLATQFTPLERALLPVAGVAIAIVFIAVASLPGILS